MACVIDLHTHTFPASGCSRMSAEELIEAAIEAGLDGVAVTDHLVVDGASRAQEIARLKYGFPVFRGVEAHADQVGDVLVYGCYRDFAPGMSWEALRRRVVAAGGVLIPAHPFRGWDRRLFWGYLLEHGWRGGMDQGDGDIPGLVAIEVLNGGCTAEENAEAARLARVLGVPGIGGSDAHAVHAVGRAATWFPGWITSDAELVAALKAGGYRAVGGDARLD
jgi:predicted metal-dependent phosphoesterase TrpH